MKVFVSSPGDVQPERRIASQVLKRLENLYREFEPIEVILSEYHPSQGIPVHIQEQLPKPQDCDMVVCILWNRMGTPLPEQIQTEHGPVVFVGPNGEIGMTGTEYEFAWSLSGWKQRGLPMLMVYRKNAPAPGGHQTAAGVRQAAEQLERVEAFERQFVTEDRTYISARHRFTSEQEFAEIFEQHARQLIKSWLKDQGHDAQAVDDAKMPPVWPDRCPFRGLARFEYQHAPVFFGRERLIQEVTSRLHHRYQQGDGFLLLIGGSGSGKSSLLRAGVAPLMLNSTDEFQGIEDVEWRVAIASLDAQQSPLDQLAVAILNKGKKKANDSGNDDSGKIEEPAALPELESIDLGTATALREKMFDDPGYAAAQVVNELERLSERMREDKRRTSNAEVRLLLVVDQFEQLFRDDVTLEERNQFIHVIESLATNGGVSVIAALRNDFYSQFQQSDRLMALRGDTGQIDVLPPSPAELEAIVRQSAAAAGLEFETAEDGQDLADRLIQDAGREPNSLPLLELALQRLYVADCTSAATVEEAVDVLDDPDARTSNTLRAKTYHDFGGISGVVSSVADDLVKKLSESERAAHSHVFWHLIRMEGRGSDDGRHISSAVPRTRIEKDSDTKNVDSDTKSFIEKAIQQRLLAVSRHAGEDRVQLTHESLVDTWPLLKTWIDENEELLPIRERVETLASRWNSSGKSRDLLLPVGKPIDEAQQLIDSGFPVSPQVQPLVATSQRVVRWNNRLKQIAVASLTLLTIAALVATWFAFEYAEQADLARDDALNKAAVAKEQTAIAKRETARANENASSAQLATIESTASAIDVAETSVKLATFSAPVELKNDHLLNALTLFGEAAQKTVDSRKSLLSRVATNRAKIATPMSSADENVTSWNTLQGRIENSEWLNRATWDRHRTNLLRQFPHSVWSRELGTTVQDAVLSPDKRLLALTLDKSNTGHRLVIWNVENNMPTACVVDIEITARLPNVCWSPKSKSVFLAVNHTESTGMSVSDETIITQYSATTGSPIGMPRSHTGIVHNIGCSPDGNRLYVVNQFDGSQLDYARALNRINGGMASVRKWISQLFPSGEADSEKKGATIYCLNTSDLTVLDSHHVDGPIDDSSIAMDTVAIGYYEGPNRNTTVAVSKFVENFDFKQVERRRDPETDKEEDVMSTLAELSSNAHYLVTNTTKRGLMLHAIDSGIRALEPFGNAMTYGEVQAWDVEGGVSIVVVEPKRGGAAAPVRQAAADSTVAVLGFVKEQGQLVQTLQTESNGRVTAFDRHLENQLVVVGATNGNVRVWQRVYDTPRTPILQLPSQCLLANFVEDQRFLTVSGDGQIKLWDLASNAAGETVRPDEISALSPFRLNSTGGYEVRHFPAPNGESTIVAGKLSDGRNVTAFGKNTGIDLKLGNEIPVNAICDDVLFTSDSRYAIILSGTVRSSLNRVNPLIEVPGWDRVGLDDIPSASQIWVYDLNEEELIGSVAEFPGPMVHASINEQDGTLTVCTLAEELAAGEITTFELPTLKPSNVFGKRLMPCTTLSYSANHDSAVVISKKGLPRLFHRGERRPSDLMKLADPDGMMLGEVFSNALISDSGGYAILVHAGTRARVTVLDLLKKKATSIAVTQTDVSPLAARIPGQDQFVVGTENGEFLIVDGPRSKVIYYENLGSRCVKLEVNKTGSLAAVVTVAGVAHVRSLPDGNLVMPDLPIPFTDTSRVGPSNMAFWDLKFLDSGDLLVGDNPVLRLRLSTTNNVEQLDAATASLLNKTPMRQLLEHQGTTDDFAELDWYDKYTLAGDVEANHGVEMLNKLETIDLATLPHSSYGKELAFRQVSLAVAENQTAPCRKALDYLLNAESPTSLSSDDARKLVANLGHFDPERTLAFLDEFESVEHLTGNQDLYESVFKLVRGRANMALGQVAKAEELYSSATAHSTVAMLEEIRPELYIAVRVEQSLVSVAQKQPVEAIDSLFSAYKSLEPRVVVGPAWINYLLGSAEVPEFDSERSPLSGEETIDLFLDFYTAMSANDTDEAIRLSDLIIKASTNKYRFQSTRPVLPITQSHASLLKADALKLAGQNEGVPELVGEAERSWKEFVDSAVQQGIDDRMLWPWRVSYEVLLERHMTSGSAQ